MRYSERFLPWRAFLSEGKLEPVVSNLQLWVQQENQQYSGSWWDEIREECQLLIKEYEQLHASQGLGVLLDQEVMDQETDLRTTLFALLNKLETVTYPAEEAPGSAKQVVWLELRMVGEAANWNPQDQRHLQSTLAELLDIPKQAVTILSEAGKSQTIQVGIPPLQLERSWLLFQTGRLGSLGVEHLSLASPPPKIPYFPVQPIPPKKQPSPAVSSGELVQRIRERDPDTLLALYGKFRHARFWAKEPCRYVLPEERIDLLQEALLQLLKWVDTGKPETENRHPVAMMDALLHNLILLQLRKKERTREVLSQVQASQL